MSFKEEEVIVPQNNTFSAQEESVPQRKEVSILPYPLGQSLNPLHIVFFFSF